MSQQINRLMNHFLQGGGVTVGKSRVIMLISQPLHVFPGFL